ncbi:meiosis regulator and mRNA stability factor 1 [Teleopsis dalmanni]|uniref:meiosis regulator and mRNA stability factor 1 n=1 Tax=Teleopsis dalmanni TaxID=139649 RepID=UPI0018CEE83D|nr:meiosis regulator and mRNA stability factor 1 [Teleopsis dalmanni]
MADIFNETKLASISEISDNCSKMTHQVQKYPLNINKQESELDVISKTETTNVIKDKMLMEINNNNDLNETDCNLCDNNNNHNSTNGDITPHNMQLSSSTSTDIIENNDDVDNNITTNLAKESVNSAGTSLTVTGTRTRFAPYNYNRPSNSATNKTTTPASANNTYNASTYGKIGQGYRHQNMLMSDIMPDIATSQTQYIQQSGIITAMANAASSATTSTSIYTLKQCHASVTNVNQTVTLQITNLDYTMEESILRNFLMTQLKPITPVVSLVFEGSSYAKVTVPDLYFAKQVVSNLHRKKIGHKRMIVSYTRDSSLTEINTLRCQVAGLLKDIPYCTLPMYKFRELFQSRFKTSINVLDLYKMQDICTINSDNNEEKSISLHPDLVNSLENSPLMEGLQHSVPYCTIHFKREQHKGWAEQEIEPLPNVFMTITEIQKMIYPLLKHHTGDIPVASLVHCIEAQLSLQIIPNDNGVNLEHLICCVQGIQIQVNNFGIKILGWVEMEKDVLNSSLINSSLTERNNLFSKNSMTDPLYHISREVMELIKMSPKSTMKFNRFIPAYHNHFGKQCRVADYGFTKLIELFEALASVIQIMGDGENRLITLTHRTQIRRFTSNLLRVLRAHGNKSILLSQLPTIFSQTQNRNFDVTEYGVCDIVDILDGLVNSNIVVVTPVQNGADILISIPKRKQTNIELEKTTAFAGEMVELFRNAPQYTILFQNFVRSYHYHFDYQCRLSEYGFLKLADLMEAINGVVEMELTSEEDKKITLSPKVAQRVFAEQLEELILSFTHLSNTCIKLNEVLKMHKKKFGYQIQPQTLGVNNIMEAIHLLPYVEVLLKDNVYFIICHNGDQSFRSLCYQACKIIIDTDPKSDKTNATTQKSKNLCLAFLIEKLKPMEKDVEENTIKAMKHAIEIYEEDATYRVRLTKLFNFIMDIVALLEQRKMMTVYELKSALNCNLTTTFEFGYPSVYALVNAYLDIFSASISSSQDRCEVTLVSNCKLFSGTIPTSSSQQNKFAPLKSSTLKQKSQRAIRAPLQEKKIHVSSPEKTLYSNAVIASQTTTTTNNTYGNLIQMPPQKQRILAENLTSINPNYPVQSNYRQQNNYNVAHTLNSSAKFYNNSCNQAKANSLNNSFYSNIANQSFGLNSSGYSLNGSNKENSFNSSSSVNILNGSFNSSANSSFSEFNNSLNLSIPQQMTTALPPPSTVPITATQPMTNLPISAYGNSTATKLWNRRQAMPYYQQQHHAQNYINNNYGNNGLPPLFIANHLNTGLMQPQQYALPTMLQQPQLQTGVTHFSNLMIPTDAAYKYVNNIPMYPWYEPPKPDTPPSKNIPFWMDPIWSNNEIMRSNNELLNIKLPEMKPFNSVLSPYTMSKEFNAKQQLFNFDSRDRKIA